MGQVVMRAAAEQITPVLLELGDTTQRSSMTQRTFRTPPKHCPGRNGLERTVVRFARICSRS